MYADKEIRPSNTNSVFFRQESPRRLVPPPFGYCLPPHTAKSYVFPGLVTATLWFRRGVLYRISERGAATSLSGPQDGAGLPGPSLHSCACRLSSGSTTVRAHSRLFGGQNSQGTECDRAAWQTRVMYVGVCMVDRVAWWAQLSFCRTEVSSGQTCLADIAVWREDMSGGETHFGTCDSAFYRG